MHAEHRLSIPTSSESVSKRTSLSVDMVAFACIAKTADIAITLHVVRQCRRTAPCIRRRLVPLGVAAMRSIHSPNAVANRVASFVPLTHHLGGFRFLLLVDGLRLIVAINTMSS
jgi:hypothetical protein